MKSDLTIIFGASAGVGKAIAYELAKQGKNLVLAARDLQDLESIAKHLEITNNVEVFPVAVDLESPDFEGKVFLDEIKAVFTKYKIKSLYLTAGIVTENDEAGFEHELMEKINRINFVGPASLLNAFISEFKNQNEGEAVVFSTIAAPVPRKKNIGYTASKNALESFCKSLQHDLADRENIVLQVYRLGYVDTSMSFGQKLLFPVADPKDVARFVVKHSNKKSLRFAYYPKFWAFIVFVLKSTPWFVYKRLKF